MDKIKFINTLVKQYSMTPEEHAQLRVLVDSLLSYSVLPQADSVKEVCGNCADYKQGSNPDNYCLKCGRLVEL